VSARQGPARRGLGQRARRTIQRRQATAVVVVLALIGAIGLLSAALRGGNEPEPSTSAPIEAPGRSTILLLSVTGGKQAMLAAVGAGGGREAAALILPPGITVVAPGQAEATTEQVQALPGPSMRIAASNALGAWADHYAVSDLSHLGALIDRTAPITVNLPEAVTIAGRVLGPGETPMSGSDVVGYLTPKAADADLRWQRVLEGFLRDGAPVQPGDLTEADDPAGVGSVLEQARGATVTVLPSHVVTGTVAIPDQPAWDGLVVQTFGTTKPIPAQVQNGNGLTGMGESVAERIVPLGFRVVLSGNADNFDHATTSVVANGGEHSTEAQAVLHALGVGAVSVSPVTSGVADITIVVGKDFTG